ncbi:brachyurin-like [Thrips palmi]|uniref:Brachyurin-like n=1 Tax=Thrips palmi TaxID=161013 RepID=A0A6P8Z895_THRPL|nr:brachyurin-like [Thrips palmi]
MWKIVLLLAALSSAQGSETWDKPGLEPSEARPIPQDLSGLRIVGGDEAAPGQFPHQVGIWILLGRSRNFCGGSIISDRVVVTAAHCATRGTNFTVVAGAHAILDESEPSRQEVQADAKLVHERFNKEEQLANDIALLRLEKPLVFNDRVQPVRLPRAAHKSFWRSKVLMSGWGHNTTDAEDISPKLRFVQNRVVSNLYCRARYFMKHVRDSNICVSGWWKKGTCQGDSGGPMVVTESDGKPTLVGLTSFGIKFGCEVSWPNVFTRVTSYLDWIREGMDKLSGN